MDKLAIIIPAYKGTYFNEALSSIAKQKNKNFIVYIGDDASPFELKQVVDEYSSIISIVYKRFDENLGQRNLVGQWERCMELVGDENWLWLFSDDDVMSENCVELFFEARKNCDSPVDVYHFDIKIINHRNELIQNCNGFPKKISSEYFFKQLFTNKIDARMPEFIFSKDSFESSGRFQNFELAFRTDTATIIKLGLKNGIETIPGALVYWRNSEEGVSSSPNIDLLLSKARATINFLNWIDQFFKSNKIKCPLSQMTRLKIVLGNLYLFAKHFGLGPAYDELASVSYLKNRPFMMAYSKAYLAACKARLKKEPRVY